MKVREHNSGCLIVTRDPEPRLACSVRPVGCSLKVGFRFGHSLKCFLRIPEDERFGLDKRAECQARVESRKDQFSCEFKTYPGRPLIFGLSFARP
jgi:hypothetical protein